MEAWPSTLLPAPASTFGVSVSPNVARTAMDSGHIRQRKRGSVTLQTIRVKWDFSDVQLEIFKAWFDFKISSGTDWFTISLPLGNDFTSTTARFADSGYHVDYAPVMHWVVTADLETEDAGTMTEEELDALLPT